MNIQISTYGENFKTVTTQESEPETFASIKYIGIKNGFHLFVGVAEAFCIEVDGNDHYEIGKLYPVSIYYKK